MDLPPVSMAAIYSSSQRFLIIFDFDETLVDENSDDAVVRVAPGQCLPEWLQASYRPGHYNEQMQRVMAYMAQQGIPEADIRSAVETLPPSPGILELLQFLRVHSEDFEVVLVSDANTYFINAWLQRVGAMELFMKIFTNPASFDRSGQLQLEPYHTHDCPHCPMNMCKRVILQNYLAQRMLERGLPFQRVCYVGDGANDFCPSTILGPGDTVFPRKNYPMHRLITESQKCESFKATVVPWASGEEVVAHLRHLLEER